MHKTTSTKKAGHSKTFSSLSFTPRFNAHLTKSYSKRLFDDIDDTQI